MNNDEFDAVIASFDEYVKTTEEVIRLLKEQVALYKEALEMCDRQMKLRQDLLRREYIRLVVSNPLGRREH